MSTWNPENDVDLLSGSEDEEEVAMKRDYHGREALLFVVDANLQTAGVERLMEALNIIRTAFISGILVNDKDLIGLIFANTKHSPPPLESNALDSIVMPQDCAVFLPLRQLTKPIVEHYLEFMGGVETQFAQVYGLAEPDGRGRFDYMIRLCIELLEKCGKKLNNAKIVYLTDVPNPTTSDHFQAALQKANDLEGKEFEFHVIPMVDDFDYEPFYKEFITLSRAIEMDAFQIPDAQMLREILADPTRLSAQGSNPAQGQQPGEHQAGDNGAKEGRGVAGSAARVPDQVDGRLVQLQRGRQEPAHKHGASEPGAQPAQAANDAAGLQAPLLSARSDLQQALELHVSRRSEHHRIEASVSGLVGALLGAREDSHLPVYVQAQVHAALCGTGAGGGPK
ncbi:ATP-dependent DNA helicase 2 subunit 1 isoform X2 [Drosophila takahashii]|uniref:ATP-dependent DNA helicase 2 subunit 1 isoform X2 n=1 Tax=Drosophila takahashii TaxID=29030 RepID=UPI0038990DF2